jgi:hypothetical protein
VVVVVGVVGVVVDIWVDGFDSFRSLLWKSSKKTNL